jgi:signal transduction histidine kinase
MMGNQCKVSDENKTITFPCGEDGVYPSLWGHSLNTGDAFYTNAPETHSSSNGLPDGHISITRFLSMPVKLGQELVGQIALANKEEDYTQLDVEAVRRLAEFYALAIQRMRVEEALHQAHSTLEKRVEERTQELLLANKRLIQEIEERKQTEEELIQSKETLQSVFDGISDPLVMLDNSLSVTMLNDAAKKFYRISDQKDALGKVCYEAMKGASEPCEGCEVPRAISSGQSKRFERKGIMDPERLEHVVVYPIKGKTGNDADAILHIRDITERKLFEKQLIQSEKLASLGILVSSIAHEINNPNSFILFNTPILKDYVGELMPIVDTYAEGRPDLELFHMPYPEFRKDLHRLLDNIEHGTTRINSVVANLREFYRGKDKKEEKWIDLKSVIEKALAMCEIKMRKTVKTFAKEIPEDMPDVYSDPHALEQILINLLLNAAQASDKKESEIKLSVVAGNSWLDKTIIQVSDNGCGIDHKIRDHIFDPFFTSKSLSDGTGLGLYVTHNLVSSLRGRIEFQSQPGEGSTFSVILPDKERRRKKRDYDQSAEAA